MSRDEVMAKIGECGSFRELKRIDELIPAQLLTNEEQLECERAVEKRMSELNYGGKL